MRQPLGFAEDYSPFLKRFLINLSRVRYGVAAECHLTVKCSIAVFRTLIVPHAARCEKALCITVEHLSQGAP